MLARLKARSSWDAAVSQRVVRGSSLQQRFARQPRRRWASGNGPAGQLNAPGTGPTIPVGLPLGTPQGDDARETSRVRLSGGPEGGTRMSSTSKRLAAVVVGALGTLAMSTPAAFSSTPATTATSGVPGSAAPAI